MQGTELISVIVPVYKVEDYLIRCLESIINQTYHNLEIIIIDDGSPDNCGIICDNYANKDPRIKVIHKKNEGLQKARNTGIKVASGRYITFVDSDDYIETGMYETLLRLLQDYGADIASGGIRIIYENSRIEVPVNYREPVELDIKEALDMFCFPGYIGNTLWNKLFKKELFDGVDIPQIFRLEDAVMCVQLIGKANKIVHTSTPEYNYCIRRGSITKATFSEKTYAILEGSSFVYNYICKKFPDLQHKAVIGKIFWEVVFINEMIKGNGYDKKVIQKVKEEIIENKKWILHSKYLTILRKLQIYLLGCSYFGYKKVYGLYLLFTSKG